MGSFLRKHRRVRRLLVGVAVSLALFTALGFVVVPAVARRVAETKLSELLHRQVTIEAVRLNPYALSATVRGLRIRERGSVRDFFTLKEVYVNLQLASLFKGGIVVRQARVVEPVAHLVRIDEERYNFSDILDDLAKGPPAPPPRADSKPARFSLSNLELLGGHIELDDRFKAVHHEISDLNISVPFVSNFPYLVDTFVQPAFSATINGTRLAIQGHTKPFSDSLESSIEVNLVKVDLPYYLAYVPVKLRMKLVSAVLDTKLKVTFIQYRERPPRVDVAGDIALSVVEVVDDTNRPLLKLPLLDITIASSDLLSNRIALDHVWLKSLAVHVRRGRKGDLQWQSLLASDAAAKSTPTPAAALKAEKPAEKPEHDSKARPWAVTLDEFKLESAKMVFSDEANTQPFRTTIDPLTVTLRHFTTASGGQARLAVVAHTDAGEDLKVEGRLAVQPVSFAGALGCTGIRLPRFAPYYASQVLFDVRQGSLDVSVPVEVSMKGKTLRLLVTDFAATLRDLQLRRRGDRDDFFRLPAFSVSQTKLDLGRREVVLGNITTSGARFRLEHASPTQPWSVETLLPASPALAAAPPPARAAAESQVKEEPKKGPKEEPKEEPFAITVGKLDVSDWAVRAEDRGPRTTAITTLDRLNLRVEGLSTMRGHPGRINLQARLNQSGAIAIAGTLGITPLQADLTVKLKTLPIVPLQPYFQDQVALLLTSGHVGANGRAILTTSTHGPSVNYKGELTVGDVVAVAPNGGEELGRLGQLRITGIDATTLPFKLTVDEIAIDDYGAQVVINPDQTINLAAIVPGDGKNATPAPKPAAPPVPTPHDSERGANEPAPAVPPVHIGAIVLRRGNLHITDRSIHPAFDTTLGELGGRIAGLSFEQDQRASVDIQGKLGNGPLAISGQINPLAKRPYVDLAFKLSDMDLSAMTPYAGKYAGYAVEKGQLYLDLKYLIDSRRLNAKNEVRVSQFTFGPSVDSKEATHLPVRLAVSLLKDRHGVIQLDVPVSGSLDDPKFSVWGVVLTVLENLLVKAATSPFALIGSLFGQGEELSWIEFEPGRAEIPAHARSKIETLGKALYERPALRLEVEGHADPVRDLEALKRIELGHKVKAEKVKETVAAGSDADAAVKVSDAEYPKYLRLAYRADDKTMKPKNALGMLRDVPNAEMERRMLDAMTPTQDDLRLLARQRAQVVREQILHERNIETERVFLIEPKTIPPIQRDKVSNSRVDFRLQ